MGDLHPSIAYLTDDVIKPDTDERQYRAIELKNQLKAIIICDPDTDKASAALDVYIGRLIHCHVTK